MLVEVEVISVGESVGGGDDDDDESGGGGGESGGGESGGCAGVRVGGGGESGDGDRDYSEDHKRTTALLVVLIVFIRKSDCLFSLSL